MSLIVSSFDGTFSRREFASDMRRDVYTCPGGKLLKRRQRRHDDRPEQIPADGFIGYRVSKIDCDGCSLKPRCCPSAEARKVMRSVHLTGPVTAGILASNSRGHPSEEAG
jgi:hypothetical protein